MNAIFEAIAAWIWSIIQFFLGLFGSVNPVI